VVKDLNHPMYRKIEKSIRFTDFSFRKEYTFTILDLMRFESRDQSKTCSYWVFNAKSQETYKELLLFKGDSAKINMPEISFLKQLDFALNEKGISRFSMDDSKRYDITITFIRHNKYNFEILKLKFEEPYGVEKK